jgi:kinesin family protein 2/24
VTKEQAYAFYSKLWRLHVDSRTEIVNESKENEVLVPAAPDADVKPFTERLKPGLFFRRIQRNGLSNIAPLLMVLAPEGSFDSGNTIATPKDGTERYVCAEVWPVSMMGPDAYQLNVASQRLISKDDMVEEVSLEFDTATRYYFTEL